MRKAAAFACVTVLSVFGSFPGSARGGSPQDEKVPLRYKFEKGQKFRMAIRYAMSVKMEEIPEAFKGLMGENPVDLKFEGTLDAEVREVSEAGRAEVEGTWKTLKAKGVMMLSEVDFDYDSEKPDSAKPRPREGPDPDLPAFGNLEDMLREMVRAPARFSADPSGRMTMSGGGGAGPGDVSERVLSLNGLMGPFSAEPVGPGGSWKGTERIAMPGVGGTVGIVIRSENRYASDEAVDGRDCAVLRSKLAVGGEEGKKEDPDRPSLMKLKTSGEGEGTTWFCVREGMVARHKGSLNVKLTIGIPDPSGGPDDLEIRAALRIEQGHEVKR